MRFPRRPEAIWILLLAALAIAHAVPPPNRSPEQRDSWSAHRGGKKVLFTLLERLSGNVRRNDQRLDPPPDTDVLLILGEARSPSPAEWRRLHDWVVEGHTLVFAPRPDEPEVELPPFGLRVRPTRGSDGARKQGTLVLSRPLSLDSPGTVAWPSDAWVDGLRAGAWITAESDGRPVVATQGEGRGRIVVAASDALFTNEWLADEEHQTVPFRLIEAQRTARAIVFDESLNASAPRVLGLLLGQTLRPLTLQILVLAVLVGWMGARTFGPPLLLAPPSRRLLTEHAAALGHVGQRAQAGAMLVGTYLEYFCREMGLVYRTARDPAAKRRLGGKMRTDADAVAKAICEAEAVVARGPVSNDKAAAVITALIEVKRRVERRASKGV